jgi:hypothetical protein
MPNAPQGLDLRAMMIMFGSWGQCSNCVRSDHFELARSSRFLLIAFQKSGLGTMRTQPQELGWGSAHFTVKRTISSSP